MVTTLDRPITLDEDALHPLLTPALAQLAALAPKAAYYEGYYAGLQRATFDRAAVRSSFAQALAGFRDNLCGPIIDAVADRLQIVGVTGQRPEDDAAAMLAWEIWQRNRLDRRSGEIQRAALTAGDTYLVVWPDADGLPRIDHTPATRMTVGFDGDQPERLAWAIKVWATTDWTLPATTQRRRRWRVTLSTPEAIYKYISQPTDDEAPLPDRGGALLVYETPGEDWPLVNPYGVVPVIHMPNNSAGGDFGVSDIASLISLQDATNKVVTDALVGAEWLAMPQRWITGLQLVNGPDGTPINPFRPGVDKLWIMENEGAAAGQFPGADLTQLLALSESLRTEMIRISGIPGHYLMTASGSFPSGESLKTAEARFVAKVKDRQTTLGEAWENALILALVMSGHGPAALEVTWDDPQPRNEQGEVDRALDMLAICRDSAPYGAKVQALRELGYSSDEIVAMIGEESAGATSAPAAAMLLDGLVPEGVG